MPRKSRVKRIVSKKSRKKRQKGGLDVANLGLQSQHTGLIATVSSKQGGNTFINTYPILKLLIGDTNIGVLDLNNGKNVGMKIRNPEYDNCAQEQMPQQAPALMPKQEAEPERIDENKLEEELRKKAEENEGGNELEEADPAATEEPVGGNESAQEAAAEGTDPAEGAEEQARKEAEAAEAEAAAAEEAEDPVEGEARKEAPAEEEAAAEAEREEAERKAAEEAEDPVEGEARKEAPAEEEAAAAANVAAEAEREEAERKAAEEAERKREAAAAEEAAAAAAAAEAAAAAAEAEAAAEAAAAAGGPVDEAAAAEATAAEATAAEAAAAEAAAAEAAAAKAAAPYDQQKLTELSQNDFSSYLNTKKVGEKAKKYLNKKKGSRNDFSRSFKEFKKKGFNKGNYGNFKELQKTTRKAARFGLGMRGLRNKTARSLNSTLRRDLRGLSKQAKYAKRLSKSKEIDGQKYIKGLFGKKKITGEGKTLKKNIFKRGYLGATKKLGMRRNDGSLKSFRKGIKKHTANVFYNKQGKRRKFTTLFRRKKK